MVGALLNCDECGRFISWDHIEDKTATHVMITPDSDVSSEKFETLCVTCTKDKKIGPPLKFPGVA